jgi:ATP-dependent exoDNAse (exonuclease V) beta subunit
VGNYFDKFMIDEFQDTSAKEWNNFLPLLRNAMSQSTDTSVLIVGDIKQSIYRWRGGDWRILGGEVAEKLPDSERVPLKNNWRSLPNIVEFNNSLFTSVIERENERLNSQLDNADKAQRISQECKEELYDTLKRAYADHEQTPRRKHTNSGYISIVAPTESGAELVGKSGMPLYIERIKEILERGFLPRDITILVRKNSESMDIAEELLYYRDQFPKELWFEITTEEALSLTASSAVKLIIAVMRLAINRTDTTSLVQYNHLCNNDYFDTVLNEEEHAFLDSIRMMSPEEAFNHITIRYADLLKGEAAYVLALHEHITRFSAGKVADLALFDKWWREKGDGLSVRIERSERAIEILTIHKAKGLENRVIVMPHCSWSLEPLDSSGYVSNIVWTKPSASEHLGDIGEFPVSFNRSVGESLFADGYFRETVYTCVDALNMLYVATTRAKEQLHLFLPNRRRGNNIDSMLLDIYAERMQQLEGANYQHYEIGTFDAPEPTHKEPERVKNIVIKEHCASPVTLKLRTSVSRYFADEATELTPRSMGIKLHRAFEGAETRDDIFETLDKMVIDGELSQEGFASLKAQISDTLDNSIAGEWFDGSWQKLHRERNILRPNSTSKRPDRVMTRGNEAVVVDYKFGEESNAYHRQIAEYIEILRQMGYTSVKGYIWYVSTGKIVQIEE